MYTLKRQYCVNCGKWLRGRRRDEHFCSPACTAAYHRKRPKPAIHADLPKDHAYTCEVCGTGFTVNDYADRGGERTAKYCSKKCKQRAYRKRKQQQKRTAGDFKTGQTVTTRTGEKGTVTGIQGRFVLVETKNATRPHKPETLKPGK